MILDGEIVALDADGKPSFNALQNRAAEDAAGDRGRRAQRPGGFLLLRPAALRRRQPARRAYSDRRRYLAQCLLPPPIVQLVHASEDGEALYEAALASGFEGVVGKRKRQPYQPGGARPHGSRSRRRRARSSSSAATRKGKGAREPLGSLLLGYWNGEALRYASHVGSGFDDDQSLRTRALEPCTAEASPFAEKPPSERADRPGSSRSWSPR